MVNLGNRRLVIMRVVRRQPLPSAPIPL